MEKEVRYFKSSVRAMDDENHIGGYGVRFEEDSADMGFVETIARGAISEETIRNSDIFCLFNHDMDKVLGRSNQGVGNLQVRMDENGVTYDCELLDNELAKTVRSYIQAGLVSQSSFAFTIADEPDAETWYRDSSGTVRRLIKKIDRLYDMSPVWTPAYPTTSVKCRGLENFLAEEAEKEIKEYEDRLNKLD